MYRLLVIVTCIVILTVHWESFTNKVNLEKILRITDNIMEEVKE
jgi:hypothetical protein